MRKQVQRTAVRPIKDELSLGGVVQTQGIGSVITLLLNAAPLLKELVALVKELLAALKADQAMRART